MDINLVKKNLAEFIVLNYLEDEMTLGLGTGSTCEFAIKKIAELMNEGLLSDLKIVPTSSQTRYILDENGISYYSLNNSILKDGIDIAIDGADEVYKINNKRYLIKGGGGALLGEKTVEYYSKRFVVFADKSKVVSKFGAFPIPVEVLPYTYSLVKVELEKRFGCKVSLRMAIKKAGPIITDSGNYILDCKFDNIDNVDTLENEINSITGVVENGIFSKNPMELVIGIDETHVELM